MAFVLTTSQSSATLLIDLHGELVELYQHLMPDSFLFENGQSLRIHLLDLTSFGIRRKSGSMLVFFSVEMTVSDCSSGGRCEVGSGIDCSGGEAGCGVLQCQRSCDRLRVLTSTLCMMLLLLMFD
jgi:hypothetical protein